MDNKRIPTYLNSTLSEEGIEAWSYTSIKGQPFFCSWSGGKDSCFALYHALQNQGIPKALLTMFIEDGQRSRSHGLPMGVLQQQAQSLGIPLIARNASWDKYEEVFTSTLRDFKQNEIGVWCVLAISTWSPHLEWVERVCSSVAVEAYEPLWKKPRRELFGGIPSPWFHCNNRCCQTRRSRRWFLRPKT